MRTPGAWNPEFTLGTSQLKGPRLREVWTDVHLDTLDWRDWAAAAGEGVQPEPSERELDLALCSPEWTRHRRIEQERIPLEAAAPVVRSLAVASA